MLASFPGKTQTGTAANLFVSRSKISHVANRPSKVRSIILNLKALNGFSQSGDDTVK
jgi:hypothetical protein